MNALSRTSTPNVVDTTAEMPNNYDAEVGLLGAILCNNRMMDSVGSFLSADHFYDVTNARLFEVIQQSLDAGAPATAVSLRVIAESDPILSAAGGVKFLINVAAASVTMINAEHYGRTIMDLYQKRQVIETCRAAINNCFEADLDTQASDIIEQIDSQMSITTDEGIAGTVKIVTFAEAMKATLTEWEAFERDGDCGASTGLRDLDNVMGTLQPQDLLVLGGRPSMGKSALAMTIAKNAAEAEQREKGKRAVAFFSLEMSRNQLVDRIITAETGIAAPRRRKEPVDQWGWGKIADVQDRLANLPLNIDDTGAATLSMIRATSRRIQRKNGLRLVVVDYLQLMGIERGIKFSNDVEKITYLSGGLKALAKSLDVPVLALSQLSRDLEKREDKRPQLSDLRQSGSIEQDADTVLFCYRDAYYLERKVIARREGESHEHYCGRLDAHEQAIAAADNIAEIIVAKARHGTTGMVKSKFDGPRMWFSDLARSDQG